MLCTIAGLDPTGGAGVAADGRTAAAHGCGLEPVLSAITEQDATAGATRVRPSAPAALRAALAAALPAAAAVKTGMLADAGIVRAVGEVLAAATVPVVVDPVVWAGAGGRLLDDEGLEALTAALAPCATLLTPNLPEAARLLGLDPDAPPPAHEAATALRARGWKAVLVKGGHAQDGDRVVDVLATSAGWRRFARARVPVGTVRGTGCTLAAAIACRLATGLSLDQAVGAAGDWLHALLAHAAGTGDRVLDPSAVDPAPFIGALPPLRAWE